MCHERNTFFCIEMSAQLKIVRYNLQRKKSIIFFPQVVKEKNITTILDNEQH